MGERTIRLNECDMWATMDGGVPSIQIWGQGVKGGTYRIFIPIDRALVQTLAYATGVALDEERSRQADMEDYVKERVR